VLRFSAIPVSIINPDVPLIQEAWKPESPLLALHCHAPQRNRIVSKNESGREQSARQDTVLLIWQFVASSNQLPQHFTFNESAKPQACSIET
jgi:hypothetical protein